MSRKEDMIDKIYEMDRFDCLEAVKENLGYSELENLTIDELEEVRSDLIDLINERKDDFEIEDEEDSIYDIAEYTENN